MRFTMKLEIGGKAMQSLKVLDFYKRTEYYFQNDDTQ